MNRKKFVIPLLLSVIFLLIAIFPINEYGYYILLRWIVFLTALYVGYIFYKENFSPITWLMAIIAILFNPIFPLHFSKSIWLPVDLLVAIIFIMIIFKEKRKL